jgi:hypothetical protein
VQSDRTPYNVFNMHYGEDAATALGVSHVDPGTVCLKPSLVGIRQPMLYETVTVMRK